MKWKSPLELCPGVYHAPQPARFALTDDSDAVCFFSDYVGQAYGLGFWLNPVTAFWEVALLPVKWLTENEPANTLERKALCTRMLVEGIEIENSPIPVPKRRTEHAS